MWRLADWPDPVLSEEREEVLTVCFDHLLDWFPVHETSPIATSQLYNAMSIAPDCLRHRPGLALKLFQSTEHVIKNLGDKHRLLEMSDFCIEASKNPSAQDQELKARAMAQAYMCGHSWVYQRTPGRLNEARIYAQKSLALGEKIGWDRNTAFARKCMGRMDRIEAEECESMAQRERLLAESENNLIAAIELFKMSREFGPTHLQVGDCYSLLGRTQLVAGKIKAASESIRMAYDVLPEGPSKEYLDLLILTGDFEVKKGDRVEAEKNYKQAIDLAVTDSREISEISARAYCQRGRNRANRGDKYKDGAEKDFERAVSIWQSLDEYELAADAEWALAKLLRVADENTMQMFSKSNSRLASVIALRNYLDGLGKVKVYARRAQPTISQVDQMLKEAAKRIAVEHPEW